MAGVCVCPLEHEAFSSWPIINFRISDFLVRILFCWC